VSNRLYVGNLPFHATEDLLKQHFAGCGEVLSVSVVTDRETGRSRGFAFVEMTNAEGAKRALTELNGKDFEGRSLRVDVAEERRSGGGGGGGGGGYGGGGGGGRGGGGVVAVVAAVAEPARAELEPIAVAIGKAWAHECMEALRADARGVIGAWPGTLAEARMRIRTTLRKRLELALLEDLARIAYVAARRGWQAESEHDWEP
jgi:cold-inducible RNA-binding protein